MHFYLIITSLIFITTSLITMNSIDVSWSQKTLSQLTLKEKIGQLFMVAAISDTKQNPGFLEHTPYTMDEASIKDLIARYHVGGIIFLGLSDAYKQYTLTQEFQRLSSIPLLIGQDLEWGLHMRLRDTIQYPYALTLGAIQDNRLIYQLGKEIGTQCNAIGVHMNFAPVVDVNTAPDNPVINHRSFGDNTENVCQKAAAFAQGLHDAGIIACAKHFPGHGDTTVDSHYTLPIIHHTIDRLNAIELKPFEYLIAHHIPAIMTAHIAVPALEPKSNVPASLSYAVVTSLLKNKLGFSGLVITDGLGMRGVTDNHEPGYVELDALLAGNDILLCPVNVPRAVELITHAIENNQFSQEELDKRVLKILSAKEWVLKQRNNKIITNYWDRLHTQEANNLNRTLYQHAVTVIQDTGKNIPVKKTRLYTIFQIGRPEHTLCEQVLQTELPNTVIHSYMPTDTDQSLIDLIEQLSTDNPIIITLHGMNKLAREQYGITETIQSAIKKIYAHNTHVILVIFGNPYSASLFKYLPGIICAYQDDVCAQMAATEILLGTLEAKGKLPIAI
jgi:beta-N-acetylhexosaminidase